MITTKPTKRTTAIAEICAALRLRHFADTGISLWDTDINIVFAPDPLIVAVQVIDHQATVEQIQTALRMLRGVPHTAIVWICAQRAPQHGQVFRPPPALKWLHGLQLGRLYYHSEGEQVAAVHLEPAPGCADWQRTANVYPEPLRISEFAMTQRGEWASAEVIYPPAQLWIDTGQWWQ